MMRLFLEIRCDSQAFTDSSGDDEPTLLECARGLEGAAKALRNASIVEDFSFTITDSNGETVGFASFTETV